MKAVQGLVQTGIFTPAEAKKYLGIPDRDIKPEDHEKILAPGTSYPPAAIKKQAKNFAKNDKMNEMSHAEAVVTSNKHAMLETGEITQKDYNIFTALTTYSHLMKQYPESVTGDKYVQFYSDLESTIENLTDTQDVINSTYEVVKNHFKPDKKQFIASKDDHTVKELDKQILPIDTDFVLSDNTVITKIPNNSGLQYLWMD